MEVRLLRGLPSWREGETGRLKREKSSFWADVQKRREDRFLPSQGWVKKIQGRCSELGAGSKRTPRAGAFCLSPDRQTPWAQIPGTGFSVAVPGSVHVSFLFFILNSCVWPPYCPPARTSPSPPHLLQSRVDWQSSDSLSSHPTPPHCLSQPQPHPHLGHTRTCTPNFFPRKGRLSKS